MVAIRIIDVEKVIQRRPILRAVNLDVPDRAISVLVGPTGSGKTTLLRIVAGLDSADTGRVLWDDRDVTSWPAHRRRVGMAFQSAPVFPSRSVRWNLSFPLRFSRPAVKALRQEERVEEVARLLDLGDDLDRTAGSLSGGEQRRVSLGRALVAASDVLLLDEPLAHLDAASRRRFQTAFRSWQRRRGITCLYVTHDGEEALAAADHVAVMTEGRVVESGRPEELIRRPRHAVTPQLLGFPPAHLLPRPDRPKRDAAPTHVLAVRPDRLKLVAANDAPPTTPYVWRGRIVGRFERASGRAYWVQLDDPDDHAPLLVFDHETSPLHAPGAPVVVWASEEVVCEVRVPLPEAAPAPTRGEDRDGAYGPTPRRQGRTE